MEGASSPLRGGLAATGGFPFRPLAVRCRSVGTGIPQDQRLDPVPQPPDPLHQVPLRLPPLREGGQVVPEGRPSSSAMAARRSVVVRPGGLLPGRGPGSAPPRWLGGGGGSSSRRCVSSTAAGVAFCPSDSRAHAVSRTLTALSGSCRSGEIAVGEAHGGIQPIVQDPDVVVLLQGGNDPPEQSPRSCSSEGSSTFTSWKRRASAGSFSKYFLYSDQVVGGDWCAGSPRASAGDLQEVGGVVAAPPRRPAPIMDVGLVDEEDDGGSRTTSPPR